MTPRPVAMTHAHDRATVRAAGRERYEPRREIVPIVRVHELEDVVPDDLGRLVAEDVANRGAHVRQHRLLVDRQHDVG